MIRSMTGYARAEAQGPWGRVSWELRAVNHRYLELSFRMPEEFRGLEGELRAKATSRIGRGKAEAMLRYTAPTEAGATLDIDEARLDAVIGAVGKLQSRLPGMAAVDPLRLLGYPGVTRQEAQDFAPAIKAVQQLFEQVLTEFTQMREREGERLAVHINERADTLEQLAAQVRERGPLVRNAWLERLQSRMRELAVDIEPQRLAQEAALSAQRLDVDEELSRLASHLVEVRQSLQRGEAVGRRLDFLMQELNREANTLSSKSQDAEMTRCAVEMKVAIEQMREQVQNIE